MSDRENALDGVTGEALRFALENRRIYVVFLALATFVYVIVDVLFAERIAAGETQPAVFGFSVISSLILTALATAAVAVPLHNYVINGIQAYLPSDVTRFALFALLEGSLSVLILLATFFIVSGAASFFEMLLGAVILVAAVVVGVLLVTILPLVAVTAIEKFRIDEPLSLSAGLRWSIFRRLPWLTIILAFIGAGATLLFLPIGKFLSDTVVGHYPAILARNIHYAASTLIFVTLASKIYVRLKARQAAGTQTLA